MTQRWQLDKDPCRGLLTRTAYPEPSHASQSWLTAMQRLPSVAASWRTHADWHQAVIGRGRLCWPERPLYEAVQS
jgi:hypothetical protein